MARNDDGDAIVSVCPAHGSLSAGAAYGACQLIVGASLAIGNFLKGVPDALLKRGTGKNQRHIKGSSPATEIFVDFASQPFEAVVCSGNYGSLQPISKGGYLPLKRPAIGKLQETDAVTGRPGDHRSKGCLDLRGLDA